MKSFRQYLSEASRKDLDDLRKEVRKLPMSKIQRSTNSGFYVAVDCKKDDVDKIKKDPAEPDEEMSDWNKNWYKNRFQSQLDMLEDNK